MRNWQVSVLLLFVASASPAWAITLAHEGKSDYVIVKPENCPPVVDAAASDLQSHLAQIAGVDVRESLRETLEWMTEGGQLRR